MFENIIGYDTLTAHIKNLISKSALPQVILLSGNPQSGKQTFATEMARALLCNDKADWYCQCSHCSHSKMLTHQDIVFMGYANGIQEVLCGKAMILQYKTKREVMFFMRAISKILRRADFLLWEMQDVWKRTIKAPAEMVREQFVAYQESEAFWFVEKKINALIENVEKLYKAFPNQMFTVQCMRNVLSWSMMSTSNNAKIIIMNKVEEMLPSAANMMLKTLEEPSDKVYFILLSNNASKIIPTIRSRTREFHLPQRSMKVEQEILSQVFKYDTNQNNAMSNDNISSITAYLDMFSKEKNTEINTEQHNDISTCANQYFQAIIQNLVFQESYITIPKQQKNTRAYGLSFIHYLTINITELFADTKLVSHCVLKMWRVCEQSRHNIQYRNINAKLVLETLFYTLAEEYGKR